MAQTHTKASGIEYVTFTSSMKQKLTVAVDNQSDGWKMQQFILDIAGRLPNLHFLDISYLDWTTARLHPTTFARFSSLHALEELVLYHVQFPSFGALRQILVSLPQLRTLKLRRLMGALTPTQDMYASAPSHKRPAIVDLIVDDPEGWSTELVRWLALTQTAHSIRQLTLDCDTLAWPESYIDFVTATAHQLSELSFPQLTTGTCGNYRFMTYAYIAYYSAVDFLRLPISTMVSLRILRLRMDKRDSWRDLASALKQLPGTHLKQLYLTDVRVEYQSADTYEGALSPTVRIYDDGLELLEPVLLEGRFKEIEIISFWSFKDDSNRLVQDKNYYPDIALGLHRKAPRLSSSGVLRVDDKPTKACRRPPDGVCRY